MQIFNVKRFNHVITFNHFLLINLMKRTHSKHYYSEFFYVNVKCK